MDDEAMDDRGDRDRSKCKKYRKELGLLQAKVDFLEEELLAERRLCRRVQDAFLRVKGKTTVEGPETPQLRSVGTQTMDQFSPTMQGGGVQHQSNGTVHLSDGASLVCSVQSPSPAEQACQLTTFGAAFPVLAGQPSLSAKPAQPAATPESPGQAQPDVAEKQPLAASGCERCCGKLVVDATEPPAAPVAVNSHVEDSCTNSGNEFDAAEEEMKDFDLNAFISLRDETLALQNSVMNSLESLEANHEPRTAERVCTPAGISSGQAGAAWSGDVSSPRPTFKFPELPIDVRHQLSRLRKGDLVPSTLRKRIVDRLYCALSAGTLYPGRLYSTAADELVKRFPQLRDASPTGCKTWSEGIRTRAKNVRRRMGPGIPEVDRAKAKVRLRLSVPKPPATSASEEGSRPANNRASAIRFLPQIELGKEEDEDTVGELVGFMKAETGKPDRDLAKIKGAMDRTFFARRYWMTDLSLTVERIVQRYPALRLEEEASADRFCRIRHEFQRMTQKDADAGLQTFLEQKIDRVFTMMMQKPSTRERANDVMKGAGSCLPTQTKSFLATACLCLLPGLVREKSDCFLKKLEPGEQHHHPTILFNGKSVFNSAAVQVALEDIVISVADLKHAISLMICMYWAFNVEYVAEARNTLAILEYVIGVRHAQLGTGALKFVSSL
ncbi:unnamed protein product [Ixodes hexagonus]